MSTRIIEVRAVSLLLMCQMFATSIEANWFDSLPVEARMSMLWQADMEEGDLGAWTQPEFIYPGGGIFNTGPESDAQATVETQRAHSGDYAVMSVIRNAYQVNKRAVRLMRWTNRAWDDGGEYFPEVAYYSTWMLFAESYDPSKFDPWDPGDGGWWNVFQFKSKDVNGESQPIWTLNVDNSNGVMSFYLYSKFNSPASHTQSDPVPIPVGEWVHVEALYNQANDNSGSVTFWQDGMEILHVDNVHTTLLGNAVWGIGNYTDHIDGGSIPGTAEVWFDDAAVSVLRLSSVVPHTPSTTRVSVFAGDKNASERRLNQASLRIERDGDLSAALVVPLSVAGTATPDIDYVSLGNEIIVPAGVSEVVVKVLPLDDDEVEGRETIEVSLAPSPGIEFGSAKRAVLRLSSDD